MRELCIASKSEVIRAIMSDHSACCGALWRSQQRSPHTIGSEDRHDDSRQRADACQVYWVALS